MTANQPEVIEVGASQQYGEQPLVSPDAWAKSHESWRLTRMPTPFYPFERRWFSRDELVSITLAVSPAQDCSL
jgi:hypothetical protein